MPLMIFVLLLWMPLAWAQEDTEPAESEAYVSNEVETLISLSEVAIGLRFEINMLNDEIKESTSNVETRALKAELEKLEKQLLDTRLNFEEIATGTEISSVGDKSGEQLTLQQNVLLLVEPLIKEMKSMTKDIRDKSDLREKIEHYQTTLPKAQSATAHIESLLQQTSDESLKVYLSKLERKWQSQVSHLTSSLRATELQLQKMEQEEVSFGEAFESNLKEFFKKRGFYLLQGFLVLAIILFLSRFFYKILTRVVSGYKQEHHSFQIRLLDLVYRVVTVLLAIAGPMMVFYVMEDWVLFSLGLLILLSMAWTVRKTFKTLWQQGRLLLNIGSVREGERVYYLGLPWKVKQLNLFSTLENPRTKLSLRLPIETMLSLISRPIHAHEPWFPCHREDWVLLSDGVHAKVVGISVEMVELVERGGAHTTYLMQDFLNLAPLNISQNFRIRETFGISYKLRSQSTTQIIDTLTDYIEQQIEKEHYSDSLLNLRVEFENAADSALELVVIADFKGEHAPLYRRMRRAIQRWCVDACHKNGWEIPFPQMQLHYDKPHH